eukprot:CAMPEP_0117660152 /NCGR_PEP_ID=MMETSP0804-20121206/6814_1 /TAXON_ID=1074897 /ORGANISM="Tetraselmis astigmatica, Strain CCMP880" /LENGTH=951 /DNA_ID=CAMNT_0005466859 /DNA_START=145 /DNA_END=3000 /DNA_ORIENTATION=+
MKAGRGGAMRRHQDGLQPKGDTNAADGAAPTRGGAHGASLPGIAINTAAPSRLGGRQNVTKASRVWPRMHQTRLFWFLVAISGVLWVLLLVAIDLKTQEGGALELPGSDRGSRFHSSVLRIGAQLRPNSAAAHDKGTGRAERDGSSGVLASVHDITRSVGATDSHAATESPSDSKTLPPSSEDRQDGDRQEISLHAHTKRDVSDGEEIPAVSPRHPPLVHIAIQTSRGVPGGQKVSPGQQKRHQPLSESSDNVSAPLGSADVRLRASRDPSADGKRDGQPNQPLKVSYPAQNGTSTAQQSSSSSSGGGGAAEGRGGLHRGGTPVVSDSNADHRVRQGHGRGKPEANPGQGGVQAKAAVSSQGTRGSINQRMPRVGNTTDLDVGFLWSPRIASYSGAQFLGRERVMPTNGHKYPLYPKPSRSSFIYGDTGRWSARSDPVDSIRMMPQPAAVQPFKANRTGREGCAAAAQPLRLVPEFSTYVYKHYAGAPAGKTLRYVHMGSIAPLPSGDIVAAYQASTLTEGAEDQRIYLSFSRDGDVGRKWSDPIQLPVRSRGAQWGPVLHVHPKTGNVWMFYAESSNPRCLRPATEKFPPRFAPGGDIMVTKTHDGQTWQEPHRIFRMADEGNTPKVIANNVHVTKAGTWMLPFWRESHYYNSQTPCHTDTGPGHGVLISRDDGRTWQPRGNLTMGNSHLYEGTVAELGDGSVIMVFRTQLGAAAVSRSRDDGETWSPAALLTADNPDSKPNIINIWPYGEVLMAYNDHTKENIACKNCRSKLTLSRLVNTTGAWDHVAQLGPSPSDYLKVHYPSMAQHGCRLLVVYSSMYACCAPFHDACDCAPAAAEVGLLMVSFKIWEDKAMPALQFENHKMRAVTKKAISTTGLWGNRWWNTYHNQSVFTDILLAKSPGPAENTQAEDSFESGDAGRPQAVLLTNRSAASSQRLIKRKSVASTLLD